MPLERLTNTDRMGFASNAFAISMSNMTKELAVCNKNLLSNTAMVQYNSKQIKKNNDIIDVTAKSIEVDTELKPSWLDSVKNSLAKIVGFEKDEKDESDEEAKKKKQEKEKKHADKVKAWQVATKKWRQSMTAGILKIATDNPIVKFLKDNWGKIAAGLALFFLKPEQMEKLWETFKKAVTWLLDSAPGFIDSTIKFLEKTVPKIFDSIEAVIKSIGGMWESIFGKKDEKGVRQGGLFGEGESSWSEIFTGLKDLGIAAAAAAALLFLFAPEGTLYLAIWGFTKLIKWSSKLLSGSFKALTGLMKKLLPTGLLKKMIPDSVLNFFGSDKKDTTSGEKKVKTTTTKTSKPSKVSKLGKVLKDSPSKIGTVLKDSSSKLGTALKDSSGKIGTVLKDSSSKIGTVLKGGLKGAAKFAGAFVGGPFLRAGIAAYDGVKGAMNADEILGKDKKDLTLRDRLAGGAGGVLSGLTFGLVDASSVAKFIAADPKKTKSGIQQLKEDEGFRSKVYKDTKGIKTIGYGFNLEREGTQAALDAAGIKKSVADLKSGKVNLTEQEAEKLMMGEYPYFREAAKRYLGEDKWPPFPLTKKDALTNMAYNLGEKKLNTFTNLREALRNEDYELAGQEVLNSRYAKQVGARAQRISGALSAVVPPSAKIDAQRKLDQEFVEGKSQGRGNIVNQNINNITQSGGGANNNYYPIDPSAKTEKLHNYIEFQK